MKRMRVFVSGEPRTPIVERLRLAFIFAGLSIREKKKVIKFVITIIDNIHSECKQSDSFFVCLVLFFFMENIYLPLLVNSVGIKLWLLMPKWHGESSEKCAGVEELSKSGWDIVTFLSPSELAALISSPGICWWTDHENKFKIKKQTKKTKQQ